MPWLSFTSRRRDSHSPGVSTHERRQNRRFPANTLTCPIGELIDLSVTGMRVACDRKPAVHRAGIHKFTITNDHQEIPLHGRIVRVERKGFRSYELGIVFVGVEPPVAESLEAMAQFGFFAQSRKQNKPRATRGASVSATKPDLYAVLNVSPDATAEEIQNAYRSMARRYHPDASQNERTIDQFQLVHDAYKTLHDPMSRRAYDAMTADGATLAPASGREG